MWRGDPARRSRATRLGRREPGIGNRTIRISSQEPRRWRGALRECYRPLAVGPSASWCAEGRGAGVVRYLPQVVSRWGSMTASVNSVGFDAIRHLGGRASGLRFWQRPSYCTKRAAYTGAPTPGRAAWGMKHNRLDYPCQNVNPITPMMSLGSAASVFATQATTE